jgi:hypothetical protein
VTCWAAAGCSCSGWRYSRWRRCAVAMTIPRLAARLGQVVPLTAGVVLTLADMGWLAQVQVTSSYWTCVALPMVLIGTGQGLTFAPLTSAGIAGRPSQRMIRAPDPPGRTAQA